MITTLCLACPRTLCSYDLKKETVSNYFQINVDCEIESSAADRDTGLCASIGGS